MSVDNNDKPNAHEGKLPLAKKNVCVEFCLLAKRKLKYKVMPRTKMMMA